MTRMVGAWARCLAALQIFLLLALALGPAVAYASEPADPPAGQIAYIVAFGQGPTADERREAVEAAGGTVASAIPELRLLSVTFDESVATDAAAALSAEPGVLRVER